MKKNQLLAVGMLLCVVWAVAPGRMNRQKIDWRIVDVMEKTALKQQSIHGSSLSKHSQVEPIYSVIVYSTAIDEIKALGVEPRSFNGKLFTARVNSEQLTALSNCESVSFIEAPRRLYPKLDKSIVEMKVDQLHSGLINSTVYDGAGVIVGIIDSGIDWKHLDFRSDVDTTKSRILFLRDLTTGKEFSQDQINNELDGTPPNLVDEVDVVGHGTHVTCIAAGDGSTSNGKYIGVAPKADLIIVKAGDESFMSDDVINGIAYIRQKADSLGKPFVINLSLGGHDGAHDGSDAEEIAIDQELASSTGRQIVIAAGNEGADSIHADGTLAQGNQKTIKFKIPSFTATPGTTNDFVYMSMWYKGGDNLTVAVTTPNNTTVTAVSNQTASTNTSQGYVEIINAKKSDGVISTTVKKECSITMVDFDTSPAPVAGEWTITVTGVAITDGGTFDIWIANSSVIGTTGDYVHFTSGAANAKLVGMPGTVETGITVGSYVTKWSWKSVNTNTYSYFGADRTNNFSTFSSMGPTRDGRQKPDVSAPGQAIAAAFSSSSSSAIELLVEPVNKYVIEQGTSMAAPHITGLVALMLQANPNLTAAEIRQKIKNTSHSDSFTGTVPNGQWGYGKADAVAAIQNVLSVKKITNAVPHEFSLQQNYPNPFNPVTTIRFSIPVKENIVLKVYSVLGAEVASLLNQEMLSGDYAIQFIAANLASGVYYYTCKAGNQSITKKMILMK